MSAFAKRNEQIWRLYRYQDKPLASIARKYGISAARVHQIITQLKREKSTAGIWAKSFATAELGSEKKR